MFYVLAYNHISGVSTHSYVLADALVSKLQHPISRPLTCPLCN